MYCRLLGSAMFQYLFVGCETFVAPARFEDVGAASMFPPHRPRRVEDEAGLLQGSEIDANLSLHPPCRRLAARRRQGAGRDMAMAEIPMRPCHVPKRRRLRVMMTKTTQSSIDLALDGVPISS